MPQLLERRHTMGGGDSLPYACELTYIESTGTQYIDLDLRLHETTDVDYTLDIKAYVYSSQSGGLCNVFNTMYEVSPYPGEVLRWESGTTSIVVFVLGVANGISRDSYTASTNTVFSHTYTVKHTNTAHNVSTTLFAGYDGSGNPWRFIKMKLYYCKITNHGTLVRDLIPVKKKDGTGCLYDKVTKTFFENKGTGSFTLGDCKIVPKGIVGEFEYTGAVQQKTLNKGKYLLQCWGAQGGYRSNSNKGGNGGYSEGVLSLSTQTTLYIYVGGSGNVGGTSGGFNGGGSRSSYFGGGGASDIRIGTDSLYARVIVAGGGGSDGGSSYGGSYGGGTSGGTSSGGYGSGGYGGTQTGNTWSTSTKPTSTTSQSGAYAGFGFGGNGIYYASGYGGAGGGGWYGGSGTYPDGSADDDKGGGGGSGYVYKSDTASNYPSGCLLNSSYYLENAQTIDGNTSFTSVDGGTETGHSGNGFVRISKA